MRSNPSKLLLDPYAMAIDGAVRWDEALFPYRFKDPESSFNDADSAPFMPKSCGRQPVLRLGERQARRACRSTTA